MSNPHFPTVFVTAATGTQGSALCRQLRALGYPVRATVRNPHSRPAQALTSIGVTLNTGDWDDQTAIIEGLQGCTHLFLCLVTDIRNLDSERLWALHILRAARSSGTKHIIYSSSISADAPERRDPALLPDDHLLARALFAKNTVEGLVQRAGFETWTILRPGFFMTNLLDPKVRIYHELFERGVWRTAMSERTRIGLVDPEDIAKFAVAVVQRPSKFHREGVEIVGERLTPGQVMERLSKAVGREFKAEFLTDEEIQSTIGTNPMVAAQYFLREGEKFADMEKTKAWGIGMGSFEGFLEREKGAVGETYN